MSSQGETSPPKSGSSDRRVDYLHALADHISQLAWIADGSGWIYWYNKRWFDYTGTTLEDMAGWGWKRVHHPDHVDRVVERITQSFETGQPWEDLFPLRGAAGEFRWFLSRALPIRDETGAVVCWFGTNTDVTEQRETEQKLRDSEARFRALAESMPQLVWTANADGEVDYYSSRIRHYALSQASPNQWRWQDFIHEEDRQTTIEQWHAASQARELYACSHRLLMADGSYRWHLSRATPAVSESGELRWFGTATDIHELKQAHEQRRVLIDELNHRVKNTLTLVQSIATQTFRGAGAREQLAAFSNRLNALAGAHDVLTQDSWQAAPLRDVVLGVLRNFGASQERIQLSGDSVTLSARAGVAIGMAMHELSTNAIKYGALSTDRGRVEISWSTVANQPRQAAVRWRELGGPPVVAPSREGFGTRLIKGIANDIGGSVTVHYHADGLECVITGDLGE